MNLLNTVQYEIIRENWSKFMAGDCMTWAEFSAETEKAQNDFFRWFCKQHNDTFPQAI